MLYFILGVSSNLGYLSGKAGFIILQSVIAGSLGDGLVRSPAITNFKGVDEKIGSIEDVKSFLKSCRQNSKSTDLVIMDTFIFTSLNIFFFRHESYNSILSAYRNETPMVPKGVEIR